MINEDAVQPVSHNLLEEDSCDGGIDPTAQRAEHMIRRSDLVEDTFVLTPPKIESYFGITRGHIHHVDNKFGFDQRLPYATPINGLFFCGAGCHPAGAVIGAAGYNAARTVLKSMGLGSRA